jgi:hypothetical protein
MPGVPLERPPRPPAGAVTDAVRGAILRRAHAALGLNAASVLSLHTDADYLPDTRALIADVEQRYALDKRLRAGLWYRISRDGRARHTQLSDVSDAEGAHFVLLELPDTEFLTALEHAVALGHERRLYGRTDHEAAPLAEGFMKYADGALRAHGAPYRRVVDDGRFEWIGDPQHHELTVQPALLALADPRLAGARAEFEEALRKRRDGTPKDLEDAIDEAAKSVESILKVLHDECAVPRSGKKPVLDLFTTLKKAQILPPYVTNLVTAAAGPRNHMASHGQGATVREVPDELADASIAAAATAITLLAHYLP